jgi:hypothetical protein
MAIGLLEMRRHTVCGKNGIVRQGLQEVVLIVKEVAIQIIQHPAIL